jgi:hypothetical protein
MFRPQRDFGIEIRHKNLHHPAEQESDGFVLFSICYFHLDTGGCVSFAFGDVI